MKHIFAFAVVAMLSITTSAFAEQHTGYVCAVRLVPHSLSPYGSSGYLQIQLTSSPKCNGETVPGVALYHLTQGATVQGADAGFLLTEGQLMTLLHIYSTAVAESGKVRINTITFGGGLQVLDVAFLYK